MFTAAAECSTKARAYQQLFIRLFSSTYHTGVELWTITGCLQNLHFINIYDNSRFLIFFKCVQAGRKLAKPEAPRLLIMQDFIKQFTSV